MQPVKHSSNIPEFTLTPVGGQITDGIREERSHAEADLKIDKCLQSIFNKEKELKLSSETNVRVRFEEGINNQPKCKSAIVRLRLPISFDDFVQKPSVKVEELVHTFKFEIFDKALERKVENPSMNSIWVSQHLLKILNENRGVKNIYFIKTELIVKIFERNCVREKIDRDLFLGLIDCSLMKNIPIDVLNAPEFVSLRAASMNGDWKTGEERNITLIQMKDQSLSSMIQCVYDIFADPAFCIALKKIN